MNFKQAFEAMKQGAKAKLPSWGGYWCWDEEQETIMMHCRPQDTDKGQGPVLDIRETQRVEYTLKNILSDEWMIADETNCPVLGGTQRLDFGTALRMVKKYGKGMRLPQWKPDVIIRMWKPECDLEKTAEAVHNAWWAEKKKQGVTGHPDMIPYSDLPEETKEYDRATARATIKSMDYMTAPYLYVESRFGRVPWKETMIELLSEEWEVVD